MTGANMKIRLSLGSTLLLCGPAHLFPLHQAFAIMTKLLGSACHAGLLVVFNAILLILATYYLPCLG